MTRFHDPSRRDFLQRLAIGAGGMIATPTLLAAMNACRTASESNIAPGADGWERVPEILSRIKAPVFPARDFVITSYGAKGDGVTDCTKALADAIGACNAAGGGR